MKRGATIKPLRLSLLACPLSPLSVHVSEAALALRLDVEHRSIETHCKLAITMLVVGQNYGADAGKKFGAVAYLPGAQDAIGPTVGVSTSTATACRTRCSVRH